jgi:hypothetical protein
MFPATNEVISNLSQIFRIKKEKEYGTRVDNSRDEYQARGRVQVDG